MLKNCFLFFVVGVLTASCYNPPRNCEAFREGRFRFTAVIDGEEQTTIFVRDKEMEIDYFKGKADTSSVRWINDCEFIAKNLNPESLDEEKSVHMKILSTTDSSYTFEYGFVGSAKKSKGIAVKLN